MFEEWKLPYLPYVYVVLERVSKTYLDLEINKIAVTYVTLKIPTLEIPPVSVGIRQLACGAANCLENLWYLS